MLLPRRCAYRRLDTEASSDSDLLRELRLRQLDLHPFTGLAIEIVGGSLIDHRIGDRIVVRRRRPMIQTDLRVVNPLWRRRIDAPVETQNLAGAVNLQTLGLRRNNKNGGTLRRAGEEDHQRNRALRRTEQSPILRSCA